MTTTASQQHFKLRYEFDAQAGDFVKADANGAGLTDAVVFLSLVYPPDGSFSLAVISQDGRTGEPVDPHELFKAWLMVGDQLARNADLDEGRRAFAQMTFDMFWRGLAASSPIGEPTP